MPLSEEQHLSPSELARMIFEKKGLEVDEATVRRWVTHGLRDGEIKMEGRRFGRRIYTSWEAYCRFDEKLNGDFEEDRF